MHQGQFAALVGFIFLTVAPALAQTPAPTTPAPAPTGSMADYWWMILLIIAVAGAIWYFMRGRGRP